MKAYDSDSSFASNEEERRSTSTSSSQDIESGTRELHRAVLNGSVLKLSDIPLHRRAAFAGALAKTANADITVSIYSITIIIICTNHCIIVVVLS